VKNFVLSGVPVLAIAALALSAAPSEAAKKHYMAPAAPAAAAATMAPGMPDLIILDSQTTISFGGCGVNDPLLTGTVAIKNQGNSKDDIQLTKPLIGVYVPENPDMRDEEVVVVPLKPNNIVTKDIVVGKGLEKEGRGFNGVRKIYIIADPFNAVHESNKLNNLSARYIRMNCK
jgi:hypothetical protein